MPFGPKQLKDIDCDLSELRKVDGHPGYFINKNGEVFCIRQMSQYRDRNGYARISTGKFRAAIHRLLAFAFLPGPTNGQSEVRHLDGNPRNNSLDNLAWGTRAENAQDMARHGTVKGSRNANAKLSEETVEKIIDARRKDGSSARELGIRFEVNLSTVKSILSGRNWRHLKSTKSQELAEM